MLFKKKVAAGKTINCPDYIECPACGGCRNYNPSFLDCLKNCKKPKQDICDTEKHKTDLLGKFYATKYAYSTNIN